MIKHDKINDKAFSNVTLKIKKNMMNNVMWRLIEKKIKKTENKNKWLKLESTWDRERQSFYRI